MKNKQTEEKAKILKGKEYLENFENVEQKEMAKNNLLFAMSEEDIELYIKSIKNNLSFQNKIANAIFFISTLIVVLNISSLVIAIKHLF